MDSKRWKRAQTVEKEHEKHVELMTKSQTVERLGKFGLTFNDLKGERILGVGAGTGMVHTIPGTERSIALDPLIDTFDIDMSQSFASPITGAGEHLPFPHETFDYVVSYNVLDHTSNPTSVLNEIHRVLSPGGELLFNVSVFDLPKTIRRQLTHLDGPHPYHFSTDEVRKKLDDTGFELEMESRWIPDFDNPSLKLQIATTVFRMAKLDAKARKQ